MSRCFSCRRSGGGCLDGRCFRRCCRLQRRPRSRCFRDSLIRAFRRSGNLWTACVCSC